MTTIKIDSFPAGKVDAGRAALMDMYAKLAKAAARTGATAPVMPTLDVSGARTAFSCNACGYPATGADLGHDCRCGDGYVVRKDLVTLTVTADTPKLDGWEFLAVVEPMDGGNMVRRVPGSDADFDLSAYHVGDALSCDHCNKVRSRLETFVVRADGSDPAVAAGTVKRVGRNCLEKFLGGKSPEMLLRSMTVEKLLGGIAEEGMGGGGGCGPTIYDPLTTMSWACSVVRLRGWVSKGAATAYAEASGGEASKVPTAYRVASMMEPPPRDAKERAAWIKEHAELTPTPADVEKAGKVLEWAAALPGGSDYEHNLSLVCRATALDPKNLGIFVSAVGSYDRAMGLAIRKAAEAAEKTAAPLGKVEFEGEIIKTSVVTSRYGYHETSVDKMTVKVTTEAGVWLAWGTIPANMLGVTWTETDGTGYSYTAGESIDPATLVGRKVKITATLEAGKDAHFVFMKRPKVEFCDVYGCVRKVKKPKTKKAVETHEKEA